MQRWRVSGQNELHFKVTELELETISDECWDNGSSDKAANLLAVSSPSHRMLQDLLHAPGPGFHRPNVVAAKVLVSHHFRVKQQIT